ncbi:hypothetical protein FRC03_005307 [Tulasnella sp. 419]|nr:hypothetical protein FRC03_005307 [Tulasnella sp. 419]
MSSSPDTSQKKRRVCIVGAGAAGSSCAYALSQHPDRYEVVVFDKEDVSGGMATSLSIDHKQYGASYINDGVQGCSPTFANTIKMFSKLGFSNTEVGMQISFGKGDDFWTNVYPTALTREFKDDIKKFGRVLSVIKTLEPIFAFIPVRIMLKMFGFSKDFGDKMVYPLVALFFGTGNQTPYISSAILERVFMDPSMKLFEYDPKSLLASIPTMHGFPKLHDVYKAWKEDIESRGNVTFNLQHEVTRVINRNNKKPGEGPVVVEFKLPSNNDELHILTFDELILACDADAALKILGKQASWKEKQVLGSVKYLYDVTYTHSDLDYMRKYYETEYNPVYNAPSEGPEDDKAFEFSKNNFRPLYYTMQYPEDKSKIEMSFDLTHYQPQFRGEKPAGPGRPHTGTTHERQSSEASPDPSDRSPHNEVQDSIGSAVRQGSDPEGNPEPRMQDHVFQTIFLDRDGSEHLWTRHDIRKEEIIAEKWWKQQSHRWQHYAKVVPFMMFINGKNNTHYAGAWTVLNMHEIAVTSGFAAAYRLGACYPFKGDEDCQRLFRLYLAASHGVRMRKEDRNGFFM